MIRFSLLVLAMTAIWGCADPDGDGDGIIPPEDLLNAHFSDTTSIFVTVERDDTVRTDGQVRNLLGSYYDPVFGRTTAGIYTNFNLSQKITGFTDNSVVDSVVLSLRYAGGYGDLTKYKGYQVIEVFEVTENMPLPAATSEGYSSYTSFNYNPVPLGTAGLAPKFTAYKNEGINMRIRLNNALGQRFMDADSLTIGNAKDIIKGVYIRINPDFAMAQQPMDGGIIYFDLKKETSKISVYYRNSASDTLTREAKVTTSTIGNVQFSVFTHDYAGTGDAGLITKLNNPDDQTVDKIYVQSMQGIRVKISMPFLDDYVTADSSLIVNKAELLLPIDDAQPISTYLPPFNLMVYKNTSTNGKLSTDMMDDIFESYYGGFYNGPKKQYSFLISQYIQKVITGKIPNDGFYLDFPVYPQTTKAVDAARIVLNGPNHPSKPMKLNLIYTRVKTN